MVLALAWYQILNKKSDADCDCEEDEKPNFIQSKSFLGIVTLLASIFLSFPYYSHHLVPQSQASEVEFDQSHLVKISLNVEGMTCTGCEQHITHEVNQLFGIASASASYEEGVANVEYDETLTSKEDIVQAIKSTGYTVVSRD